MIEDMPYLGSIKAAIWLLVPAIFVIDCFLPGVHGIYFAYLIPHFFSVVFKVKNDVLFLAVVTTVLILLGSFLNRDVEVISQKMLERLPAIISCWGAAYLVIQFISLREIESAQKDRFKAVFQYAAIGIVMTNQKGQIILANPTIEKMFGYEPDEMTQLSIEALIPQRFTERHIEHRAYYNQNQQPRSMGKDLTLFAKRKDSTEFPVEISLSPFNAQKASYAVAFVIDTTIRVQNEQSLLEQRTIMGKLSDELQVLNASLEEKVKERTHELESTQNELQQALEHEQEINRLKNHFVSMASHEFRTPLTSVASSAALINQYALRLDIENIQKHSERIQQTVGNLNNILTDFLSIGKLEQGKTKPNIQEINIHNCLNDVIEEVGAILKPGQNILVQSVGSDMAKVDKNLMHYVLVNLISNASKYSPEHQNIDVNITSTAEFCKVSIKDKGRGIPEEDQKHLFSLFFRATNVSNDTKGTGLGLYIVKRYVDIMGGSIGFSSKENQGSEFWVQFEQ